MFTEAIESHKRATDRYGAECRDSISASIADSLRDSLSAMGRLATACEEAGRKLRESRERSEEIKRRRQAIMGRVARIVPSLGRRKVGFGARPDSLPQASGSGARWSANDRQTSTGARCEQTAATAFSRQNQAEEGDCVMNEKDNEAAQEFAAAFSSMQAIEGELKLAESTLSSVLKARSDLRSLADVGKQLDGVRVVDDANLRQLMDKLQKATDIRNRAVASVSELEQNQNRLRSLSGDIAGMRSAMEAVRPELERFYKWWRSWKGTSGKTKRLMRRVDAVLSRCDDDEAQSLRVGKTNDALYQEAVSLRQKWTSESFDRTRLVSQANDDRRKRGELIERVRRLVDDIATGLSALSGRPAEQFSSSRAIEDGKAMSVLAPDADPDAVVTSALNARRQALSALCDACRRRQPTLASLSKDDLNATSVFPRHVVCAETTTGALGAELSVPYALPFPFEKPIVLEDESDIVPFLVRLLYVLPLGKLHICAIDHKSSGENVGVLNALCGLNNQLRIVTSADDITSTLREIDDRMGEMSRSVFSYKEPDWSTYNGNHPGAALPLCVVPIFSLHGFSATQLDILRKLLENGPRFGIICVLAGDAPEDLDERMRKHFDECDVNPVRIAAAGTSFGGYANLALRMSSARASRQRLGELAEAYVAEYREVSKKPMREIRFASLFDGCGMWEGNSTEGISAAIGWDAAGQPVNFELGMNTYHALVGGATGSGKSVFLHTMIQSLAGKYSPDELLFYLLDYKKGDEFKKYADAKGSAWLPHVKMISRHKDPRFALELFGFLDSEFKRRSDLFGNYGDIVAYRKNGGKVPRIVVVIDEFQVMFEEYCGLNLSDEVAKRLSTVFKQGRSYGIHLVLATQSLASLHFSGMAGVLGQIGLRIALKGMAQDGILADGNRAAENIVPKRQCVVNRETGRKDADGKVYNIITDVPFSDPAQVEDCKNLRSEIEEKARARNLKSSCRVFNGAELPQEPDADVIGSALHSKKWNTFFTLLLGARTDFASTPFAVDFTEEQREHLIVAGEDGSLSTDSEVRITGEEIWNGLRRGILCSLRSCAVLYYNPALGEVPEDVPENFIRLSGRAREKELLEAFRALEASASAKKIVLVENFQDARLLHPGDAPRASFSSRPAEPQPETPRSIFASLFNGTDDPKCHVIIMTKNFGFMNKEVLARTGAETNLLKGCAKRVAFNLSDDDLTAMIPHQKVADRRGPRRVWFEDMRTGSVLDFLPYGNVK